MGGIHVSNRVGRACLNVSLISISAGAFEDSFAVVFRVFPYI